MVARHQQLSRLLIPVLVFLLALSLRLYHLPARYIFGGDEEYQATYAQTIVADLHPIWMGVSASDTGFYLGPGWTYLTSILLSLSSNPLITGYFSSLLGAITATLLYFLGKKYFSYTAGLIAGFLYGILPLIVYFDQKYWNPSAVPILAIGIVCSCIALRKSSIWLIPLGILLAAIFHTHLSLVPLFGLALFATISNRNKLRFSHILLSILAFITVISPLIIFDIAKHGENIKTPLRILAKSNSTSSNSFILTNAYHYSDSLSRLFVLKIGYSPSAETRGKTCSVNTENSPGTFIGILLTLELLFWLTRRDTWMKYHTRVLAIAVFLLSIGLLLYPGETAPYYLLGLFPLFLLQFGIFLSGHYKLFRLPLFFLLIGLSIYSIAVISRANEAYGLGSKLVLVNEVSTNLQGSSFDLQESGVCYQYEGWRYLFSYLGSSPTTSSTDNFLGWLYHPSPAGTKVDKHVVIYATQFPSENDGKLTGVRIQSGGFTAVIY